MSHDFEDVYKAGCESGYHVASARQYYSAGDVKKPILDMIVDMPYTADGEDMTARVLIDLSGKNGPHSLRTFNSVEFYAGDRNIEDIVDAAHRDAFDSEEFQDMRIEIGEFASAASEYPHVMTRDEYNEAQRGITESGARPADIEPAKYSDYLEKMARLIRDGMTVIGDHGDDSGYCEMAAGYEFAYEGAEAGDPYFINYLKTEYPDIDDIPGEESQNPNKKKISYPGDDGDDGGGGGGGGGAGGGDMVPEPIKDPEPEQEEPIWLPETPTPDEPEEPRRRILPEFPMPSVEPKRRRALPEVPIPETEPDTWEPSM